MGTILVAAAYTAYTAFWVRVLLHVLLWWRVARRFTGSGSFQSGPGMAACGRTALDILFFARLLTTNAALWLGEWIFHVCFVLVLLRHLRFFLDPVPAWVWSVQTPGLIAGYLLPVSLLYILLVRALSRNERYSSSANLFLLAVILVISVLGLLLQLVFRTDLTAVKYFMLGILGLKPVAAPASLLFSAHFVLVLVFAVFVPTHIFSAPITMWEARKREESLMLVMHEKRE